MKAVSHSKRRVSSSLLRRLLSGLGARKAKLLLLLIAFFPASALAKSSSSELVAFQEVHIGSGETRDRDLVCFGCTVTIEGTLDGDLVGFGTTLGVSGTVTGDTVIVGGKTALSEHARLTGDLVTVAGRLKRAPGAVTTGDVVNAGVFGSSVSVLAIVLTFMLPMVVMGVLAVLLAFAIMGERRVGAVAEAIHQHAGAAVVVGVLVVAACIVLGPMLLLARPFGGAIGSVAWLAVMLASIGGYAGLSFALGRRLTSRSSPLAMTILGAVVISVVILIPIAGWLMWLLLTALAVGGCALSGFGSSPDWFRTRRAPARFQAQQ